MPDLRVALLGYGLAGSVFHAPLIAATPGLALRYVVTSRPVPGGLDRLDQAQQVWERADEVDLVVVATPNDSHAELALAAIAAGLPVVVDKPLARTAAEAEAVLAAARRAGTLVVPFHNRRWDGDLRTVRRLVAAGELGRVARFESRFERWRPAPKPGWREQGSAAQGAGLLLDLGSHLVDQALHLFGPVTEVYAELDHRRSGVRAEDDVFLALTHDSGVRSHLWASAVAAELGPRFRVLGDRAAYVSYGLDPQEAALRAGEGPGPGWGERPATAYGLLGTPEQARPVRTEPGAWPAFYAGLVATLREGAPPPVEAADAVAGLRVLDAARERAGGAGV